MTNQMKLTASIKTRLALPLLAFILTLCVSTNIYSKQYLHQTYLDTTNASDSGMTTWGDSSVIYTAFAKNDLPRVLKSNDLGYTWDMVYDEWIDINNHYPLTGVYFSIEFIEHPAPGYTYLLYRNCGLKHLDERTGEIVDSVDFGFEVVTTWKGLAFDMRDSVNGIIYHRTKTFVTNDGWKTFKTSKTGSVEDDDGNYIGFGMVPSRLHMLSSDTVLFWGYCYIDSLTRPHSFNKLIIEDDSIFRYEKYADTLLDVNLIDGVRAFEYFSDTLMYFVAGGRRNGNGQCKELEIFKMTGPDHKITQIYRKNIPRGFFGLEDLAFKDEMNGVAVGDGIIIITSDGGDTWEIDTVFYTEKWDGNQSYWWNPRVDFVDNMLFIGTFNEGLWKWEDEKQSIKEEKYIHPKIYPNPVQAGQKLNIQNKSFLFAQAYIYDIQGNEVDSFDFNGSAIPIRSDLPAGAYILIVEENGKYPVREKFIVE